MLGDMELYVVRSREMRSQIYAEEKVVWPVLHNHVAAMILNDISIKVLTYVKGKKENDQVPM